MAYPAKDPDLGKSRGRLRDPGDSGDWNDTSNDNIGFDWVDNEATNRQDDYASDLNRRPRRDGSDVRNGRKYSSKAQNTSMQNGEARWQYKIKGRDAQRPPSDNNPYGAYDNTNVRKVSIGFSNGQYGLGRHDSYSGSGGFGDQKWLSMASGTAIEDWHYQMGKVSNVFFILYGVLHIPSC